MAEKRIQSFQEFWPFYLGEHRNPRNRRLHYIGTGLVISVLMFSLISQRYVFLLLLPCLGYGFAWVGHFKVELNRPATFTYPIWSLLADFKMFFLAILGRMPAEMIKFYGSVEPDKNTPRLQ